MTCGPQSLLIFMIYVSVTDVDGRFGSLKLLGLLKIYCTRIFAKN